MSFDTMKLAELKKVAEDFGVDVSSAKNKADHIAMLLEEGVTYELVSGNRVEMPEPPVFDGSQEMSDDVEKTFIKMERENRSYSIYGYTFTKEDPFVPMPMTLAQKILETENGFRMATSREVKEYYS
jgi:hypothetical protein